MALLLMSNQRSCWRKLSNMEEELLYHYTSLETLYAIISNIKPTSENEAYFTLRATHASFLNDLNEGRLLPEALKEIGINENKLWLSLDRTGYPFVLSLSELCDDLNMWRCYADQGRGVAIGLDMPILDEEYHTYSKGKLDICKYVSKDELVDTLKKEGAEKIITDGNVLSLDRFIVDKLLVYKDKTFTAEREWRIHVVDTEDKFRVSLNSDLIIPFKELKIPIVALKSITLGAKCEYERNHFSLSRILSKYSQRIKIQKSHVPLT